MLAAGNEPAGGVAGAAYVTTVVDVVMAPTYALVKITTAH